MNFDIFSFLAGAFVGVLVACVLWLRLAFKELTNDDEDRFGPY